MIPVKNKYFNPLLHILIWSLLGFILFSYPSIAHKGMELPDDFVIKQVVHFILMAVSYYANTYILIPYLLYRNKYNLYALCIVILAFIAAYILAAVENILNLQAQMQHIWGKRNSPKMFDQFGFLTTLITLGISTSISAITKIDYENKKRLKQEKEQVSMELAMLKAQIHPHFFFNALHSIYALSFTDAEGSRKILTRLSAIMRYQLYETNDNTTTLEKELNFISHYVEIMKKRLNDQTTIDFNIPEQISTQTIAPMILMPYVENVFKHGMDENENTMLIHITATAKGIELKTRNKIAPKPSLTPEQAAGGIGMQNTQRRLDLLYKNHYKLFTQVIAATNEFELSLELDLS